jgi:hypothetical protein
VKSAHTEKLYVFIAVKLLRHRGRGHLCVGQGWDKGFDMIGEQGLKDGMQSYRSL